MDGVPIRNIDEEQSSQDISEQSLLRLLHEDPEAALNEIVAQYRDMVYFVSYRILRNAESALDATQEIFIKIYNALPRFKGQSKLKTWIYRITVNHCINFLRKQSTRKEITGFDERIETEGSSRPHPRKELENMELKEKISWAVEQLPPQQRAIFILRNFDDFSFDEIAETLKLSSGGVKSSYFHAIRKMRDLLQGGIDHD